MSQTNCKSDNCYMNQQSQSNKSVFDYVVDTNMFVNKHECNDYTPPFLSYIPLGTPKVNVDIENELRGSVRMHSRCATHKYNPKDNIIYSDLGNETQVLSKQPKLDVYPNNKTECGEGYKILPKGYGPLA